MELLILEQVENSFLTDIKNLEKLFLFKGQIY